MLRLTKATAEMERDTEQTMKLEYLYKVGSECDLNPWPDSSVGCSVLTEFIGRGFKSHSGRLSIATSNGSSVVNTIYISSFCYTYVITSRKFRLDKRGDWRRQQPKWNLTLNKRWNWSGCAKLTLRAIWVHGVIAQPVVVSERNSVVVGSNPTQANFL